jgi:hypothetical protein
MLNFKLKDWETGLGVGGRGEIGVGATAANSPREGARAIGAVGESA